MTITFLAQDPSFDGNIYQRLAFMQLIKLITCQQLLNGYEGKMHFCPEARVIARERSPKTITSAEGLTKCIMPKYMGLNYLTMVIYYISLVVETFISVFPLLPLYCLMCSFHFLICFRVDISMPLFICITSKYINE